MPDDAFEPQLGPMRAPGSPRGKKYLHAVLAAATRAGMKRAGSRHLDGNRIGRGSAAGRLLASRGHSSGPRARRAIVKTRLVRLAGTALGAARAHLHYIQRDGAMRDGAPGRLYSAHSDDVDGKPFLDRCASDRHQFRFIVSAEDGAEYADLRPLIRRFMARMEEDLGTALDWVAADHADTAHPHTHVILRGVDDRGENLVIAREYIASGMRERVGELVSLDLGPRTDREIEARQRGEIEAERLTGIDRRLLRAIDGAGVVGADAGSLFERALRAGRLRKLGALGLAEDLGAGRWRLAGGLEDALRALGERGDVVRTLQRALTAARLERAQAVFDSASDETLVGRLVARGLADEQRDRHYLVVDAIDGRAHYAAIGSGEALEALPEGAVVRLAARAGGVRDSDRAIAAIAAAQGGRYDAELHRQHDPSASPAFLAAHARRLEALRRPLGLERDAAGVWRVGADHLERVARHEARAGRDRPVAVEVLSAVPPAALPAHDGATWLDAVLGDGDAVPVRDAGFGRELRAALAARQAWLLRQGLASDADGEFVLEAGAVATLRRRELLRVAADLAAESGKAFTEVAEGARVEGVVARRLDLASGRFAMIESGREFALVPWRPVLQRAMGKAVSGVMREAGTSWTIARGRELGR